MVEILVHFGGNWDHGDVATPFFGLNTVVRQVGLGAVDIGTFAVDFVNCDDDFGVGGFSEIDCLDSLGLDAVISGDHDNDDIGQHSTVLANSGKSFVAGSVEKSDESAVVV